MRGKSPEQPLAIRYLLGEELSETEQNEFEHRLFADKEFLEQLQAVELELMARYLQNDLGPRERHLFESRFLLSTERRETLDFLRTLFRVRVREAQAALRPSAVSARERIIAFREAFSVPPMRSLAAVAVLGIGLIAVTWGISRNTWQKHQLTDVRPVSAPSLRPTDSLPPQIGEQQPRADQLAQQVDELEIELENKSKGSGVPVRASGVDQSGEAPKSTPPSNDIASLSARELFFADRILKSGDTSGTSSRDLVAAYLPLGIRCRVLMATAAGPDIQVSADQVFASGDRIRFSVDVNDSGYLYIITQGSRGKWSVLFPSDLISKGDNRIQPAQQYEVPAEAYFSFVGQPGVERLFVIFSRQPEKDLDELIYTIANGQRLNREPRTQPPPGAPIPAPTVATALPNIDNGLVNRIRDEIRTRDLVLEKVDDQKQGVQEKAVYAVNPRNSADSRVMLDLELKHQ